MKISWPSRYGSGLYVTKYSRIYVTLLWNGWIIKILPAFRIQPNIWRKDRERLPVGGFSFRWRTLKPLGEEW